MTSLLPETTSENTLPTDVIFSNKLLDFVEKHGIKSQQFDIRPWGGYQIALQYGNGAFIAGKVVGSKFTTHQAVVDTIYTYLKEDPDHITEYLGNDLIEEFKTILKEEGFTI